MRPHYRGYKMIVAILLVSARTTKNATFINKKAKHFSMLNREAMKVYTVARENQ